MRLHSLNIKDYKNLNIDFRGNTSGIIAFIGNNGSGKSNVLEGLSFIFHHLYHKTEKDIPFNFSLEYEIGAAKNLVSITKQKTTVTTAINGVKKSDPYRFLPKQIVAIYSGEEDRLWKKCYRPMYMDYVSNITSGKSTGISIYNEVPRMLYINKFYWHISLLTLLLQSYYNPEDTFCKDVLNIQHINSIKFEFNKSNYQNYADSAVKAFIQTLDMKDEYSLDELHRVFEDRNYSIIDVYKYLYISFTPDGKKMLKNIIIKYNDDNLEVEDFSEGEKKMLLIKSALEFAGLEDSLFILDEPDAHVHLSNKIKIKNVFNNYSENRQVIITTHSPTLTDAFDEDSLFMLNRGQLVPQKKQEILESVSGDFWNKFQQSAFIGSRKPIILLVEGKHDKEHITNAYKALNDEYKDLDFEIFKLNAETNIQPFLRGLYESDFDNSKIYIGLFDRERTILDNFKNPKNYDKIEDKTFYKIKESDKQNANYFVTSLPEIEEKKCDCSIEMMYEYEKWEEAYQKAVSNTVGKTTNKSIKDYSNDVLNDAKNILSGNSNVFSKEDFNNFRKLFDLMRDIKKFSESLMSKEKNPNKGGQNSKPISKTEIIQKQTEVDDLSEVVEVYTNRRNTNVLAEYYNERKIIIKAGSKLSKNEVASCGAKAERKRTLKIIAEETEEHWILKEDESFDSVSGAINYVTGGNMNGWDHWVLKQNNKPLQTLRR